jgi:hypothetical protein
VGFEIVSIMSIKNIILIPQGQLPRSVTTSGPSSLFHMQCILLCAAPLRPNKCCAVAPHYPSIQQSGTHLSGLSVVAVLGSLK